MSDKPPLELRGRMLVIRPRFRDEEVACEASSATLFRDHEGLCVFVPGGRYFFIDLSFDEAARIMGGQ